MYAVLNIYLSLFYYFKLCDICVSTVLESCVVTSKTVHLYTNMYTCILHRRRKKTDIEVMELDSVNMHII